MYEKSDKKIKETYYVQLYKHCTHLISTRMKSISKTKNLTNNCENNEAL